MRRGREILAPLLYSPLRSSSANQCSALRFESLIAQKIGTDPKGGSLPICGGGGRSSLRSSSRHFAAPSRTAAPQLGSNPKPQYRNGPQKGPIFRCGGGGIRTLGDLRLTAFRVPRTRPGYATPPVCLVECNWVRHQENQSPRAEVEETPHGSPI